MDASIRSACAGAMVLLSSVSVSASAQTAALRAEPDPSLTAIRCELRSLRTPDADQVLYFYLSDVRRQVLDTGGNLLGNVVQYTGQRVVVSRNNVEGGARLITFDRMVGSVTLTGLAPSGTREPWIVSGECQKVDAGRQKF